MSRNGPRVYRDESGPGFDETSVTNDPDSRPALFSPPPSLPPSFSLTLSLSFSAPREIRPVAVRALSLSREHDSSFIVSSKAKDARRTLGVT